MTDKQQPDAFCWATELAMVRDPVTLTVKEAREVSDEMQRMHAELERLALYKSLADEYGLSIFPDIAEMTAELETLRAKIKTYEDLGDAGSDVQLLRMGYAAAVMATASAQGLRDGVASLSANAGEPVAWLYESPMPDGSVFTGASAERLQVGVGTPPGTIEKPLYTAPQPAPQQEAQHLAQALTDRENQPNQYGVEFGMSGTHMHFKIGNQLFKLAYEPDEQEEFDFMKRMLVNAFTTFTHDVKTAPQPSPAAQGDALDAAFEAVRKRLCKLPRYSFALDSRSNLRRCEDKSGNWIEFDAVHALFDPAAIDAARAAQEGEKT